VYARPHERPRRSVYAIAKANVDSADSRLHQVSFSIIGNKSAISELQITPSKLELLRAIKI
jgi:hypothetical protein